MNAVVEKMILDAVRRQPFWQRYSNTIVAAIGALAAVLSFVATLPLNIDERWSGALPAAISVLTMIAVKLTKNGLAPSAAGKVAAVAPAEPAVYAGGSSVPSVTPNSSGLPVYDQPSSALGQAVSSEHGHELAAGEYVGQHRAD